MSKKSRIETCKHGGRRIGSKLIVSSTYTIEGGKTLFALKTAINEDALGLYAVEC